MGLLYFSGLALLVVVGYLFGRSRAALVERTEPLHSRPSYHGSVVALSVLIPMVLIFVFGMPLANYVTETQALHAYDPQIASDQLRRGAVLRDIISLTNERYSGQPTEALRRAADVYASYASWSTYLIICGGIVFGLLGIAFGLRNLSANFRPATRSKDLSNRCCSPRPWSRCSTTIGIVASVVFETFRFFERVPVADFLFGTHWSPQTAIRADQAGSSGSFGIVPLVTGTLLITFIAMFIAGPIGLFAAIYMAEYATPRFRNFAKPILEILAGIPTVVLGFFAALTLAPIIRASGEALGLNVASESALAAGIVMGMMIIPFVSSLSDDIINAVPQSLRDGSYGMGATKSETIRKVVLPAAFGGIVSAFMLATLPGPIAPPAGPGPSAGRSSFRVTGASTASAASP